jgi:NADH-quinone oxidoreductase subunit J
MSPAVRRCLRHLRAPLVVRLAALAALIVVSVTGDAPTAHAQPGGGSAVAPAGSAGSAAPGRGTATRIELAPGERILQPVTPPPGGATPPVRVGGNGPRVVVGSGSARAGSAAVVDKPYRPYDPGDIRTGTGSSNKLMALAFWLFAAVTVGGAIFVITRKNLIAAVMGMVGSFFGVAAVYMMLFASFLAVVQMLVYAGAIMVLFVFVIMILNKPEDEPWGSVGVFGKGIAGLGMAYLAFRLISLVWSVVPLKTSGAAPALVKVAVGKESAEYAWGSTRAVGNTLFNGYLFPFEAVSILLLVAVVGAIAVARPLKDDDGVPPAEGQE